MQYVRPLVAAALAGVLAMTSWACADQTRTQGPSAGSMASSEAAGAAPFSLYNALVVPAPLGVSVPGLATTAPTTPVQSGPTRSQTRSLRKMAELAAAKSVQPAAAKPAAVVLPYSLRIGTFNVLGSQHTVRGAQRAGMAPGSTRARWAAAAIAGQRADVVGFSEMQGDQYAVMMASSPGFASYPGTLLGKAGIPTTVMWRTARFDVVGADTLKINFLGQVRPMPVVHLKDRRSNRTFYVVNVHNSPVQGRSGSHQAERNVQMATEIELVKTLLGTGDPVFLIGDMNEHEEVFCKVSTATGLTSPAGGSSASGCRPPGNMRVDWIFGKAEWSGYSMDRSLLIRRSTDHTVLFATALVK